MFGTFEFLGTCLVRTSAIWSRSCALHFTPVSARFQARGLLGLSFSRCGLCPSIHHDDFVELVLPHSLVEWVLVAEYLLDHRFLGCFDLLEFLLFGSFFELTHSLFSFLPDGSHESLLALETFGRDEL